jgi:DNA-binding LacI/PurR family transcriptional regulator
MLYNCFIDNANDKTKKIFMRKVTLKDIAAEIGVTTPTISAALSNTGRVSDQMRQKVRKAAQQMGYHPNIAARMLKSKRNNSIGLVINDKPEYIYGSGMFEPIMVDFIRACEADEIDYQIELCDMLNDTERLAKLMTGGVVGGIIYAGFIGPQVKKWQQGPSRLPIITLDEISNYCLINNYREGINQAIQYLAALGHRHIRHIGGPVKFKVHAESQQAMIDTAREFSLDFDEKRDLIELAFGGDNQSAVNTALEYFRKMFKENKIPSALLCSGARVARTATFAAMEAGLRVPADLSIISISASWESAGSCPPLSSIERDSEMMISRGISLLRRLMRGKKLASTTIDIPSKLVTRDSTAKFNK